VLCVLRPSVDSTCGSSRKTRKCLYGASYSVELYCFKTIVTGRMLIVVEGSILPLLIAVRKVVCHHPYI